MHPLLKRTTPTTRQSVEINKPGVSSLCLIVVIAVIERSYFWPSLSCFYKSKNSNCTGALVLSRLEEEFCTSVYFNQWVSEVKCME